MCGITGAVWQSQAGAINVDQLRLMTTALSHRGPDGDGYYHWQSGPTGVALGHRRLSIIDLAAGQQPMSNEDDTIHVVFNGEIYNYRELQTDLRARGHRFKTACDTEVLLHLYEDEGPAMLQRLRGMFAFAIWDQPRQQLLLARDRLGQKPLIYRHETNRLLFASELKAILQLPDIPRVVNRQAIDLYLAYQYVPHPHCILEGFHKLPPAHYALWKDGEFTTTRYWQAPFEEELPQSPAREKNVNSPANLQQQLRQTLTEAVRLRLRSDVPLGAFLSGGIDSTIITGLMQRELGTPVDSFSIGFEQTEYDERSFAREAAAAIGTRHHEHVVRPSALESLPRLIWHYDEPFADSSAIPTLALCEITSRSVKVALTGDGGDEIFAGYDRYQAVRLAARIDRLPGPLRSLISSPVWSRLPTSVSQKSLFRRLKRFQASIGLSPELRYLQWISQFQHAQRQQLYTPELAAHINSTAVEQWFADVFAQVQQRDIVTRIAAADQISYLPGDILNKVDIASMACGLECRSPFLDHRVAELAARLPIQAKLRGKVGKMILRETFADLLPVSILNRKKMGFGVPVDHWFRGELRELLDDYLLSERTLARGYFRRESIERLISEHTRAQQDHAYRLWSLLVLEAWHRMYIDQPAPASAPAKII